MTRTTMRKGVKYDPRAFFYSQCTEATGDATSFSTDQDKTATPTLTLGTYKSPAYLQQGYIKRIHYLLDTDTSATYTLRLWRGADADNNESVDLMLYESPSGQVDGTDYDRAELDIPFSISPGSIYYSIDWTATPTTVIGFINVSGECVRY